MVYFLEQTAVQPAFERPFSHTVAVGYPDSVTSFEVEGKCFIDALLDGRQRFNRRSIEVPVRLRSAGQKIIAQGDGAPHTVLADVFQPGLLASVFHHLKPQGQASAVPVHLRGDTGEAAAAAVLLVGQLVVPFLEKGLGRCRQRHNLRSFIKRKVEDALDDLMPVLRNLLIDIHVIELRIFHLLERTFGSSEGYFFVIL